MPASFQGFDNTLRSDRADETDSICFFIFAAFADETEEWAVLEEEKEGATDELLPKGPVFGAVLRAVSLPPDLALSMASIMCDDDMVKNRRSLRLCGLVAAVRAEKRRTTNKWALKRGLGVRRRWVAFFFFFQSSSGSKLGDVPTKSAKPGGTTDFVRRLVRRSVCDKLKPDGQFCEYVFVTLLLSTGSNSQVFLAEFLRMRKIQNNQKKSDFSGPFQFPDYSRANKFLLSLLNSTLALQKTQGDNPSTIFTCSW